MIKSTLFVATAIVVCGLVGCAGTSCKGLRPQSQSTDATKKQAVPPQKPSEKSFAEYETSKSSDGMDIRHVKTDHIVKNFVGKVYAIGDLHGDLAQTYNALMLTGAIDTKRRWVGKHMVVVQTGDQIDRGDEDKEVLDELERLAKEAHSSGSRLIVLNGNHELMNSQLDLRYTTKAANMKFSDAKFMLQDSSSIAAPGPIQINQPPFVATLGKLFSDENLKHFGFRAAAFTSGQNYALLLSHRPFYAIINDSVFVHGGISTDHIRYGLEKFNEELSHFFFEGHLPPAVLLKDSGPFWMRDYSTPPNVPLAAPVCAKAATVLEKLGVKRMVVGHTVQNKINSACDDTVWRVDIGMSKAYGHRPAQVLEIDGDTVRVLNQPVP